MPEVGKIQSTNFQALLTELGITRSDIPFGLRSEVTPVVLVGGQVTVIASPTPAYRIQDIFTEGVQTAPAANSVLATTGPLPRGQYTLQAFFNIKETNDIEFQWRNVAGSANIFSYRFELGPGDSFLFAVRLEIGLDGEAFRFRNVVAGNVGITYSITILART